MYQDSKTQENQVMCEDSNQWRSKKRPSFDDSDCISVGDCVREEYNDDDADCFCD